MPDLGNCKFLLFAIVGFVVGQASPSFAVEGIGNASAVSNKVEGVVGGDTRTLALGSAVFQNELLRTGAASEAKLVFLDATNLSVGPQSEVTLDRFVYDPQRDAGAVVVRTGRGIFRFVTGTQKPQNYLIQTPIAAIGVRGTIFDLLVQPDRIVVILISGQILVTTLQNRTVSLIRPGTSLTVYLNGRVVGPTLWRGTIRVDFASASFPYFPPVPPDAIKPKPVNTTPVTPPPARTTPVNPPPVRAKPVHTDPAPPHRQRVRWRDRPERVHHVRPRPPIHYPQQQQQQRGKYRRH